MKELKSVVFYTIEKTIKTYRQFAQRRLVEAGSTITVDQWLVLNVIQDNPDIQQGGIADMVFKDRASVARMMDLLVIAGYVVRTIPEHDRRTVRLALTRQGERHLAEVAPIVEAYRKQALKGIASAELDALNSTLRKLQMNCDE